MSAPGKFRLGGLIRSMSEFQAELSLLSKQQWNVLDTEHPHRFSTGRRKKLNNGNIHLAEE